MNIKIFWKPSFILGSITVALIAMLSFFYIMSVNASQSAPLDQAILTDKALDQAQQLGLQGVPKAKVAVQMNLGEWLKLIDAELGEDATKFGLTQDKPVFVLAVRGDVVWQAPTLPRPDQKEQERERFDNITVVLDARTGELLWYESKRAGFPMPVPVDTQ